LLKKIWKEKREDSRDSSRAYGEWKVSVQVDTKVQRDPKGGCLEER